jgi:3-dehydroquinate dehydratase-2
MNILVLQGPNLNLLGLKSANVGDSLTLDKFNRAIRIHVRNTKIKLKIIQTHKEFIALNFIQRNRNQAKGLVIIPTSWAKYNQTILETITLSNLPTAAIYFDKSYSFGTDENMSILLGENIKPFTGTPLETTLSAIDHIANKND